MFLSARLDTAFQRTPLDILTFHLDTKGITLRQSEDDDGSKDNCTLGHEFCGRVASAPAGSSLKVGQAVMVDPRVTCRRCDSCQTGKDNMCHKLIFLGGPGSAGGGGLSEYAVIDQRHVHPLPDNVSLDFAALIEPLTVGHHAVKAAGISLEGRDVLVLGGGPVGLALLPTLRAQRPRSIFLSEPTATRANNAHGVVDKVINPISENVGDSCRNFTNGKGVDVVFDCAGVPQALAGGIDALIRCGSYVNMAVWDKQVRLKWLDWRCRCRGLLTFSPRSPSLSSPSSSKRFACLPQMRMMTKIGTKSWT